MRRFQKRILTVLVAIISSGITKTSIWAEIMIRESLLHRLLEFRRERDWEQFHTVKNLCVSLNVEAGELLELYQWRDDTHASAEGEKQVKREIADVAIYLNYLCYDLGFDIEELIFDKLMENKAKYPSSLVKGSSKKYSEYD